MEDFFLDNLFKCDVVGGEMGAAVVICLGFGFVSLLKEILARHKTKDIINRNIEHLAYWPK